MTLKNGEINKESNILLNYFISLWKMKESREIEVDAGQCHSLAGVGINFEADVESGASKSLSPCSLAHPSLRGPSLAVFFRFFNHLFTSF
jgi:hypothetical protein